MKNNTTTFTVGDWVATYPTSGTIPNDPSLWTITTTGGTSSSHVYTYNPSTQEKEKKDRSTNMFNFDFGSCGTGVRMSMHGLAVKNSEGHWVTYDKETKNIINVDTLSFEGGKYFYKIPVPISKIAVGDIVKHNGKLVFVVAVNAADLDVIDPSAGEKKTIILTKSPFGFDFATKIVSLFDGFGGLGETLNIQATADKPFGNMLPLLMLNDNKDFDPMMLLLMDKSGFGDITANPLLLYALMNKSDINSLLPFLIGNGMNK